MCLIAYFKSRLGSWACQGVGTNGDSQYWYKINVATMGKGGPKQELWWRLAQVLGNTM